MVNMAWLVIASMMMTGVLERIGFIAVLMRLMMRLVSSTGSLIASTMASCVVVNVLTGDQYMAIVLPGQMWKAEFEHRGLASVNLSRTLEDAGTLASPLIPWNACGVYMAGTLAVTTFAYLPYCFFNLINPVIALLFAFTSSVKGIEKGKCRNAKIENIFAFSSIFPFLIFQQSLKLGI